MRNVHPFQGMKTSHEDTLRFWDDYADQYSSVQQGDIPERIVDRLSEMGIIGADSDILELGSGPGTYSMPLATHVRTVTCMDTSQKMLDRLMSTASSRGLSNISSVLQDWTTFVPDRKYSVCMASLCPGTGSSESLEKMESVSTVGCVQVSWMENHGDDLTSDIWHELGKEYGFDFRKSNAMLDWLRDNGRDPTYEVLETHVVYDVPIGSVIEKERSAFNAYGVLEDVGPIVERLLENDTVDGIYHYDRINSMKLITWRT